jgi:hypothetical protein
MNKLKLKRLNYYIKDMPIKTAYLVAIIIFTVLSLSAKNIPLINKETFIPKNKSIEFGFASIPQNNRTTLLSVKARIDYKTFMGSMQAMRIFVNGREVKTSLRRGVSRLVNKPLFSPVTPTKSGKWFHPKHGWRLIYGPDFKGGLTRKYYTANPYELVLDITDFISPDAENRIKITNGITGRGLWKFMPADRGKIAIQSLKVNVKSKPSPMMLPTLEIKPFINRGEPAAPSARYHAEVSKSGGLSVEIGGQKWQFESAFSYPNVGLNYLPAKDTRKWKVKIQRGNKRVVVSAKCSYYTLERTLNFTKRKIEVHDKLTNMTNQALGMLIRHQITTKNIKNAVIRLAGNPDPVVQEYISAANPSIHVSTKNSSFGMICYDDVLRNQSTLFSKDNNSGFKNDMFRLNPRKSYTLRWDIYPVAGPDYYDFINLVRQDWKANYTIHGSYTLIYPDKFLKKDFDTLKKDFARHGIRYVIPIGPFVKGTGKAKRIAFGTEPLEPQWEDMRRKNRLVAKRIRKINPNIKVMVYFDSRRDSSKNSNIRFKDSVWIRPNGKELFTKWGIPGNDYICYTFVPSLKNSFGRKMFSIVDKYIAANGADSIYWDEMSGGGGSFGYPKGITYNREDDYSCILDKKNYTIKRKVGLTKLLVKDYLVAMVKKIHGQGRPLLGNGPPSLRAMLELKVQRMCEVTHNNFWHYEMNLGSPLGWTYIARSTFDGTLATIRKACLPVGVPLPTKHEISRFLFPFTPIELHHAYLLGKERIITLHDGNYGWVGKRCLVQLRHFNKKGRLVNDDNFTLIAKEARTAVKLAKEEAMVLVRLPMSFESDGKETTKWSAKVKKVNYGTNLISLYLEAPQGGILKIDNGKFALQNGKTVKVTLGNKIQQVKIANDCLIINIPANFSESVEIANANLIENVKAAQNGAKKFKQKIETVDIDGEKVFVSNKNGTYTLNKIKVKAGKKYAISVKLKQLEGKNSYVFIGFIPYTKSGAVIKPQNGYNHTKGSFTVLTAATAKGDKSITVKDASKWKTGKYFVAAFNAKQDKSDMPNFDIISGCVKIEKNTITLKNVLKKAYSAGTKVRQHRYGPTYIYTKNGSAPTVWSTWKGEAVQGEMLRKATYIRPMIIVNNKKDSSVVFDNFIVEEF